MKTNKHGKYGFYFDTKSHGGDNFKFRAYAPGFYVAMEDCIKSEPDTKFTVWLKIYLDYVWMTDRNGLYPTCTNSTYYEYKGVFDINKGNFDRITNTYDDCFIELERGFRYVPNTPYQFAIWWWEELLTYGDQTGFRPPDPDRVMLLGVDALNHVLPDNCGGLLGLSYPYWWVPNHGAYYNYVAVGYYQDGDTWGMEHFLDRSWERDVDKQSRLREISDAKQTQKNSFILILMSIILASTLLCGCNNPKKVRSPLGQHEQLIDVYKTPLTYQKFTDLRNGNDPMSEFAIDYFNASSGVTKHLKLAVGRVDQSNYFTALNEYKGYYSWNSANPPSGENLNMNFTVEDIQPILDYLDANNEYFFDGSEYGGQPIVESLPNIRVCQGKCLFALGFFEPNSYDRVWAITKCVDEYPEEGHPLYGLFQLLENDFISQFE